jgi:hypothetical protein
MATNSRMGASIGPARCYIGKATEKLVSLRSETVTERHQISSVITVIYRREKPIFRRVAAAR